MQRLLSIFVMVFFLFSSIIFAQNKKPRVLASTISFTNLTGGEGFCPGASCTIQWQGVPFSEVVTLEYSTNGGTNWTLITNTATGLSYNWTVPNTPSTNCVARVISVQQETEFVCVNNEVRIGTQIWNCMNLNVSTYRNGDPIPEVTNPSAWTNLTTGAWCYYNNDPTNGNIYGKLYNWYAVNDPRGLAPSGWHVASDDEWKTLEKYIGMSQIEADTESDWRGTHNEGGKLKEAGTSHFLSPNTGANNESGFLGLPGGFRHVYGECYFLGENGNWWTSTEFSTLHGWFRILDYSKSSVGRFSQHKVYGHSVRCVKD